MGALSPGDRIDLHVHVRRLSYTELTASDLLSTLLIAGSRKKERSKIMIANR